MPGGKGNIKPEDGKQFSKEYQPEEKWTEEKAIQLGDDLINWLKKESEDESNIFFEDFLIIKQGLYPELIHYLKNKFQSFKRIINKAKKIQEIKLVKYGVDDRLNAQLTKFVLTNHHNYSDKSEVKTDNKTDIIISFED